MVVKIGIFISPGDLTALNVMFRLLNVYVNSVFCAGTDSFSKILNPSGLLPARESLNVNRYHTNQLFLN